MRHLAVARLVVAASVAAALGCSDEGAGTDELDATTKACKALRASERVAQQWALEDALATFERAAAKD